MQSRLLTDVTITVREHVLVAVGTGDVDRTHAHPDGSEWSEV
ncbi:hypothetical protein [Natrarchaeobaculum aegyptiacum]|nr:hypothetical protein [Natrarchaeobaculum aegyptiacum]